MIKPFKFKEFTVHQDQSAMKIGTDAVLLGAWASLRNQPNSILDIGTGTGIISLQLAQRSNAVLIDALEIDDSAYQQAVENFENSPWADRLFCYHASLEDFSDEMDEKYNLIISNPPFYDKAYESVDEIRNKARFTSSLLFKDLIRSASSLLSDDGIFAVIIPFKEESNFISLALEKGLFSKRICRVKGTTNTGIKRSLLEFSFLQSNIMVEELTIEIERHRYTKEYKDLVKDFYLKM